MEEYPQEIKSIPVARKIPVDQVQALKNVISECELALGSSGRTVVRYSGTENKIRILVEAEQQQDVDLWVGRIEEVIKQELC